MKKSCLFRLFLIIMVLVTMMIVGGCEKKDALEKIEDLDYEIVEAPDYPEEIKERIHQKKGEHFRFSYSDEKNTYLVYGFGKKTGTGFHIQVDELYRTKNAVYYRPVLMGEKYSQKDAKEYEPIIVIRIDRREETIVFL